MKFVSLYKGITLSVQGKYTNCTNVYKIILCEWFQSILNHFFFFFLPNDCIPMLCTLFNSHIKIPIFSPIMIFGEKIDPKSFTIFSTKQLKIWLIHLHEHISYDKYEICDIV